MKRFILVLCLLLGAPTQAAKFPSDAVVDGGYAYFGSIVVAQWTGARAAAAIWNPVGSGKVVYVDRIVLAHGNGSQNDGCDLRILTAAWGSLQGPGHNKRLELGTGVAELRWGNLLASELPTPPYYECWMGPKLNDHTYDFTPALRLAPGYGLMVPSSSDNTIMVLSAQYREYPQ